MLQQRDERPYLDHTIFFKTQIKHYAADTRRRAEECEK